MDAGNMKDGESSTPLVENNDGLRNERLMSPLFTSVPVLNEAASYLSEKTSYITHCFSGFSGYLIIFGWKSIYLIASDILRGGQLGDYVYVRRLLEIIICKVIKGDVQALEDLTYDKRKEFLRKHRLPRELPVVSLHTEASISPAVLATISRVAHAELPMVAPLSAGQPAKLPVVIPLGAAMAACAQLLQVRYGEKSDGLVTCRDAEVPGSVLVRPKRKLDHAWMVYSSLKDDPSEADASQVCEALLTLLVEVGQKKSHELNHER